MNDHQVEYMNSGFIIQCYASGDVVDTDESAELCAEQKRWEYLYLRWLHRTTEVFFLAISVNRWNRVSEMSWHKEKWKCALQV